MLVVMYGGLAWNADGSIYRLRSTATCRICKTEDADASDYKSKLCLLISAAYLSCSFHIDQSYSCGWSSSLFCSTFLSFATQPPWIIRHGVDWRNSAFIKWTGWTLAMALPWWQHHKHCLGYYYYRCWSALSEYWNCLSHTHLKSN